MDCRRGEAGGKFYIPGPGETLDNFTGYHLRTQRHRQRVNERVENNYRVQPHKMLRPWMARL
ncbi:hypothetical protein OBBRIDRAFT_790926 [Obba rivulosa]|uniref:Uncharacterized protein n=1 Tax=Obba rivulosa TaxID=1052685 RepID=A0A8E2AYP7_9APHY|nr:hypothetical protein OBBRIDRAFT_790926 [Obba rivulosa]